MISRISIDGMWQYLDDSQEAFSGFPPQPDAFRDSISLPGTTETAGKGAPYKKPEEGCPTRRRPFLGTAWLYREIDIPRQVRGKKMQLFLERTRLTSIWINGEPAGSRDSLCTPHIYDISAYASAEKIAVCIAVNNRHYPISGGHMTSQDTQTNWNGITGEMSLRFFDTNCITSAKVIPDAASRCVTLLLKTDGVVDRVKTGGQWEDLSGQVGEIPEQTLSVVQNSDGTCRLVVPLPKDAPLWDEYTPIVGRLRITPCGSEDVTEVCFGLSDFKAEGMYFTSHGRKLLLRGKHDGMVFPLTGAAPTDVGAWLRVMGVAKEYGINHYRFHTCCPPDAAFTAADLLGIYMEPELPFWGTVAAPGEEGYRFEEQAYLVAEGARIIHAFSHHPSFVMFSLGNELWGSPPRLGEIIRHFKRQNERILYTQGSNNFQFYPNILPEDDFFAGVRLSKDRLIRGSYATCDMPLGHIQTDRPSADHSYDPIIAPASGTDSVDASKEIEIQYGTGVKKVRMDHGTDGLNPDKPVVTHEIGQYCVYPDFREIAKYTGVLAPCHLEKMQKQLEEQGMADRAEDFFLCSGRLAVQCYKEELETVMRSASIAGFQLLDLQDFPGQGTALVGMLDAFMDSKGLIEPERWRGFCSDSVILAEFPDYVVTDRFSARVRLRHHSPAPVKETLRYVLCRDTERIADGTMEVSVNGQGLFSLGGIALSLPPASRVHRITLTLTLSGTGNVYTLWQYPVQEMPAMTGSGDLCITEDWEETEQALSEGKRVLFFPAEIPNSLPGFYCTEFWCYPMFRDIARSMGKPEPVGTMGLCIDTAHPALAKFACESWSTPQWHALVSHSRCAVLDGLPLTPIVQMIDNFERCHKLGLLFECTVGSGKLLVCTIKLSEIKDRWEAAQFARSILQYVRSQNFLPGTQLTAEQLAAVFRGEATKNTVET